MSRELCVDTANVNRLPAIPGGWTIEDIRIEDRCFQVTRPAVPDEFLDDPEVLAASQRDDYMPYWPYLWPAAMSMARAVVRTDWQSGVAALEIGAGIGLVGLAALSRGVRVTFSDSQQTAVELALHNAHQNGFANARGTLLDWRHPREEQFSVILGCDVVYETCHHRPILDLLERMLDEDGVCWIGDPGRLHAQTFIERARHRGFSVEYRDEFAKTMADVKIGRFGLIVMRAG